MMSLKFTKKNVTMIILNSKGWLVFRYMNHQLNAIQSIMDSTAKDLVFCNPIKSTVI